MSKGPNNHGNLFDLLGIRCFDNVNDIEAAQGRITSLPFHFRTFTFDLLGDLFGQLDKMLWVIKSPREKND